MLIIALIAVSFLISSATMAGYLLRSRFRGRPILLALATIGIVLHIGAVAIAGADAGAGGDTTGIATSPVASAKPAPATATPAAHESLPPIEHTGDVLQAIKGARNDGGIVAAAMVVLFIAGSTILRMLGSTAWITRGKRLVMITSALGIVAAIVDVLIGGASWETVAVAVAAAVGKIASPVIVSA